jgi:hypothetical protein
MKPTWVSVTLGNARFIIADSNFIESEEQKEFLYNEISGPKCKSASFCILMVHIAPYIEYWEKDKWNIHKHEYTMPLRSRSVLESLRSKYLESHPILMSEREMDTVLFKPYPIDFVISGHQHNYQRGLRDGTTFCIIGGGGGQLDNERVEDWNMYKATHIENHFATMSIDSKSLSWEVYNCEGILLDSFTMSRRSLVVS